MVNDFARTQCAIVRIEPVRSYHALLERSLPNMSAS